MHAHRFPNLSSAERRRVLDVVLEEDVHREEALTAIEHEEMGRVSLFEDVVNDPDDDKEE
jgi:hypothetical protein